MDVVRGHFRPEFLNRLDEIILFHRLGEEDMAPIVDDSDAAGAEAAGGPQDRARPRPTRRCAGSGGVGYDPVYGARPLKRVIQQELQNPLATLLLAGKIADGDTVHVSAGDGSLTINGEVAEAA